MPRRPPLLIALQTEGTILMCLAIGQAGLAAAFLTGGAGYKPIHAANGIAISIVTVSLLITAVGYQRSGGPRWPVLASGIVLAAAAAQIVVAKLDFAGAHIFGGVIFVTLATVLTSYLFWFGQPRAATRTG